MPFIARTRSKCQKHRFDEAMTILKFKNDDFIYFHHLQSPKKTSGGEQK